MSDKRHGMDRRKFLGVGAAAAAGSAGALLVGCKPGQPRTPPTTKPVIKAATSGADPLATFGVSDGDRSKVMARAMANGGDFCDLFFQNHRINYLGLEDHAVNRATSVVNRGVGIRVVQGIETGYAFTESLDLESMLQAAEVASAVASGTPGKAPAIMKVGKLPEYYPVQHPWGGVSTKMKVKLLMKLHDLVGAKDKRVSKVNISYRDEESVVVMLDSEGRLVEDRQPMVVCYVSCVAEEKGKRESNRYGMSGRAGLEFMNDTRLEQVATELVRRTTVLFEAVPGPVGEFPVVLGPGSSGILLHEAIGHGMEADFARKKTTIFTDMIGKKVAPDFVTIVDDGTNKNLRGSINVDDEGNAAQRTLLVENGILRTFLHDRISSRAMKVSPTGNGRRQSFRHMVVPRMRNTYMLAGPHAPEEIIKSVKKGIYAETFTNGEVNIGAGDYTFYVKNGYLIEDGELSRPIKDVNIIGNGPESLKRTSMVGTDFKLDDGGWTCGKRGQRVPVGLGIPTVKISAITVGGAGKKA